MRMKAIALLLIFIFAFVIVVQAEEMQKVKIIIDDKEVVTPEGEPEPFINKDYRILVTARFVLEALDFDVSWDNEKREAKIEKDDISMTIPEGTKYAHVNGKRIYFDTESFLLNGRLFVPLRFVAEALGYEVSWDTENYTANLKLIN